MVYFPEAVFHILKECGILFLRLMGTQGTIGTAEKYMPMEKMIIMEISSGGSMSMITYKRCS